MRNEAGVCHKLNAVIYLQDTVTGELVTTSQVEFFRDGKLQAAVRKESGIYAFLNMGTDDIAMTVRAFGYCDRQIRVSQEVYAEAERSCTVPLLWISMIPGTSYPQKNQLHTISGTMDGIQSVCGIPYTGWQMRIREYDRKAGCMKLFNPHGRLLYPVDYGIMDQEKKTFELFTVKEQINAEEIRILAPVTSKFSVNSPIERAVMGSVKEGNYLLRLRRDVESYLIRWSVQDHIYFRELNMQGDAWQSLDGKGGGPWDK